MRRRSWIGIAFITVVGSLCACTALLGDFTLDGVSSNDGGGSSGTTDAAGCTPAQKGCNNTCVSKEDPSVGCGAETCSPCPAAGPNAAASCKAGACSVACNTGFSDCDNNPANGCEVTSATDIANCGACGKNCGVANTETKSKCENSKCVFACKPGFGHCGPDNDTGCETDLKVTANHCGACGHSCLGGECKDGKCLPFQLASASNPSGVAVDDTHVYFTFPSVPAIQRVQRDGKCTPAAPCPQDFAGSPVGDPLSQIRGPSAIVSDGKSVWWTNQANSSIGRRAATLPPGPITNFGPARSTEPGYIALGNGKVWWTNGFANIEPSPHVGQSDPDGGALITFAQYANPANMAFGFGGIVTDATGVYWASEKYGVYHAAFADPPCIEGGLGVPACKQYGSASGAYGIAVDANFVYWTEPGQPTIPSSGSVKRAPKAGGQSIAIAINQDRPKAIAILDTFVYWGNQGTGNPPGASATGQTLRRAPQVAAVCDGAACEEVDKIRAGAVEAIVAANDGLYWTNRVLAGGVYRLAK
jgi:hypothetical protein